MDINEKLAKIINERGIKQSFIVEHTDMSADAVSQVVRNKRKLTAGEFLSICDALNISPEVFM